MPKAEGSLQASEATEKIGLVAHRRQENHQADFNIVEDNAADDIVTRQVKAIIRTMTHVSPQRRLAAATVVDKLRKMVRISG